MKLDKKQEKVLRYAVLIAEAVQTLLDPDNENYIGGVDELEEGKNATHFTHALANMAPAMVFAHLTGSDINLLEFNHMANRLCFQYMTKEEKE